MTDTQLKYALPGLSLLLLLTLLLGATELVNFQMIFWLAALLALLLLGAAWAFSRRVEQKQQEAEVLISHLRVAASIYLSVYLLDLRKDEYIEIRSTPLIRSLLESADAPIADKLQVVMVKMATPEFLQPLLDFTNLRTLPRRLAGKTTITQEFFGIHSGWCRARFVPLEGEDKMEPMRVIYAVEEINEEKRREKELVEQAEQDLMTGVLNRGTGEKKIADLLMLGIKGMICLIDLDNLKKINDTHGHLAGDAAIICLADTLKRIFREGDLVMRYGGDEFVVFVPDITDERLAGELLERLQGALSRLEIPELGESRFSASIGAVLTGEAFHSFSELIRHADACVYECKQHRGTVYRLECLGEK